MNYETDEIRHRPQNVNLWETERMKSLKKHGLIGCFNGTGVTSENYKRYLRSNGVRRKQKIT